MARPGPVHFNFRARRARPGPAQLVEPEIYNPDCDYWGNWTISDNFRKFIFFDNIIYQK